LYTSKKSPDNIDGIEIVNMASFFHHIPNSKVEAYAEALKKEYRQFCRDKKDVTA
jgi:hypothetical protein